ncbi:MAG: ABC transporter permease [Planctomycetaceae bacterium]|nr:ABC transporter permease [Planctomycetaceae bacterium]
MRFHTFVLKNLIRRRVRSTLTVIGMAVAVGGVVALVGVSSGSVRSFVSIYEKQKVSIVVDQKGAKQRLTSSLPEELGEKIAKIPGVKQVNGGLVDYTSLEDLGISALVVQGWIPDSPIMRGLNIEPGGHWITASDKRGVLLGEDLAKSLEKKVGDKLQLFDDGKFTVLGIVKSSIPYESTGMWVALPDLQKFMGRPGQVSGFTIVVDHPEDKAEVERIRSEIAALGPSVKAKTAEESVKGTTEIRFIRATSWITSAIAIIIGAVGVLNTMIMSVSERTREIGILRAIGWRRRRIVQMIMMESVGLSLVGGIIGTVCAVVITPLLGKLPAVAGLINANIADPRIITFGIAMAIVMGLLGAAYPAYRGAQLMPTEALRHE